MKVAVWHGNNDIRIEERPTPVPNEHEALVKVISCGICGSDIAEWYRLPRAPLVPGHEIGAEVVEVGNSVKKIRPKDRVFIAPKAPCMECFYCKNERYPTCSESKERLPGGFAEYVLVPPSLLDHGTYSLPDAVTYDQSVFIEPLACVLRAWRLAGTHDFQSVMIIGCGMSGFMHIKLAKTRNAKIFAADINNDRLKKAVEFGADAVFHADENIVDKLLKKNRKKADLVVLCAPALSAIEQAWECVDKGGVIVFFAAPGPDKKVDIPINALWTKEIKILTSYYCGPPDIAEAIRLIETKTMYVDDMITHRLPLNDTAKGFKLVIDGGESMKVIIKP